MDGLLIVLGLIVLAIPVAVVVLLVGQSSLKARLAGLEARLSALERPTYRMAPADDLAGDLAGDAASPDVTSPDVASQDVPAAPQIDTPPPIAAPPAPIATEAWPMSGRIPSVPRSPAPGPVDRADMPPQMPPDGPIVLRADRAQALMVWLQRNWIYVVSAASLALAGVFLVQYSVQNGLLPPWARVVAAYVMGAALITAGEWLRRRKGDGEASDTAYLPSVFAGAGLVTLFAATTAARQLYDLIGPNMAFFLHVMTAGFAVGLGWFYGPLLVAVGLIGASFAPFLIASQAAPSGAILVYYALIAATGLAVDAVRRWAWVSVLALVLGYGGGWLMLQGGAGQGPWLAFLVVLPLLSVGVPTLRLMPDHAGPAVLTSVLARGGLGWPVFPTRLAAGAVLVSTFGLWGLPGDSALISMMAYAGLTVLALTLLIWTERADGLADLALLPALALILRLAVEGAEHWPLAYDLMAQTIAARPPETAAPLTITLLVALATLITAGFAYRALRGGPLSLVHGLAAVLTAPVAVAVIELFWRQYPIAVLGAWGWALHPMALAVAMVALAARFARSDGADHRRMAYATLSALSLVALALFLLTLATALTLALAVLAVVAAALDRRYTLREMGLFIQIAVAVLSWRLMIDPGIDWAMEAPLWQVLAAYLGTIAAQVTAFRLLRDMDRVLTRGVLESAAMALTAVLANILLTRWLVPDARSYSGLDLNYVASLNAVPWLVMMLTQAYRAQLGGSLHRLRLGLAAVAGVLAAMGLLVSAVVLNPLFALYEEGFGAKVQGPLVLDTLALSYAVPGLMLLIAAWRLKLPRRMTLGLIATGAALMTLYTGLEIRRFWQGDWLGRPGVTQPELYSYTVALMLVGAALLYQSIASHSTTLRRIGMAVIALTIAKVFLIDAAGLTGLTRVFSFLGLGLSLAGLAWLNRWAGQASAK